RPHSWVVGTGNGGTDHRPTASVTFVCDVLSLRRKSGVVAPGLTTIDSLTRTQCVVQLRPGIKQFMRTIVVGYEASGASERALERAAELAEALRARLVVVSVEPPLRLPATVTVPEIETVFVPGPAVSAIPPGATLRESAPERPD